MIECASNTYQSSLRELHFIDRLPPLSLSPLAVPCCFHAQNGPNTVQWKFLLIWTLLLVFISEKRHCRGTAQTSPTGSACMLLSVFRYADVPDLSTHCDLTARLCSLPNYADCQFVPHMYRWHELCCQTIIPELKYALFHLLGTWANFNALLLTKKVVCSLKILIFFSAFYETSDLHYSLCSHTYFL